jgi:rRNA maturation endonuclease Nob1
VKRYLWRCKTCKVEWESEKREGDTCDICEQQGTRVFASTPAYHPTKGHDATPTSKAM